MGGKALALGSQRSGRRVPPSWTQRLIKQLALDDARPLCPRQVPALYGLLGASRSGGFPGTHGRACNHLALREVFYLCSRDRPPGR